MSEQTKVFIKAVMVRAIRTFCQGMLGFIGASAMVLSDVDWIAALSAGCFAAVLSILMSVATGLPEADSVVVEYDQGE